MIEKRQGQQWNGNILFDVIFGKHTLTDQCLAGHARLTIIQDEGY